MKITTVGVDLAKDVFQVHGVDAAGKTAVSKRLRRSQMAEYFARLEPCLIGMEACGSGHYWARKLMGYGHTVKLMSPQFVKPYVKTNKNDARDAEAICEAVGRPNMRFVPIKTISQQAVLAVHRARAGLVKARTAQANQIRGLLAEFGIIIPKGIAHISERMPDILEDGENELPGAMRHLLKRLTEQLKQLGEKVSELEREIQLWHRENETSCKLEKVRGIGPITASALVATVNDARCFKNGRQMAAWVGIVPRQNSTGGKQVLLGISKRGDSYLRTLLIQGAHAVIRHVERKTGETDNWLKELIARRGKNKAAVALANKNARIAWALLRYPERTYEVDYKSAKAAA
jgi:transposase